MNALVAGIAERLLARGEWLAVAESCTGGGIAAALTDLAGSSTWFERGLVTYSNSAKTELLGVPATLIQQHGAVSAETARAMAEGVLARTPAHWSLAVTGIAGPGGGSAGKPVGTVWIAWMQRGGAAEAVLHRFDGDRAAVRAASVQAALAGLRDRLDRG
ncbi:MAG TPA: CinA family protein [Solimonas sp.]|nr:CinA family protein [Solimonas sp.]